MSIAFDADDGAIVLPAERHPKLAVAPAYPEPTKGWIVMKGYECEGLHADDPHTVYFDFVEAEQMARRLDSTTAYGEVIEVSIPYTGPWAG